MKQIFLYSILFILFAFTKEKIIYKSNIIYDKHCDTIDAFINDYNSGSSWEHAINSEYCRSKEPDKEEEEEEEEGGEEEENQENDEGRRLKSHLEGNICCYISILDNSDNWNYFCGKITPSDYNEITISEYIKNLKKQEKFTNKFKDIKIDCYSKKLDFMINILIISLIYLF